MGLGGFSGTSQRLGTGQVFGQVFAIEVLSPHLRLGARRITEQREAGGVGV